MSDAPEVEKWLDHVRSSLEDGSFVRITLSGCRGSDHSLKQILVRRVKLGAGERLSFVYRHETRDVTKHIPHRQGVGLLRNLAGGDFRHAHLFTTRRMIELERRDGRHPRIIESKPVHTTAPSMEHDRRRNRSIDPGDAPWLQGLGVTTTDGQVCKGMEAKFRQIGRFVELLQHLLAPVKTRRVEPDTSSNHPFTLVDMGCGKGYLTFAACDWLRRSGRFDFKIRGIEARAELVDLCNRVSEASVFSQLRFETGTIAGIQLERVDVLVALHACDTATDDAIAKGIAANASLILVSPCCHKELRPRLRPPTVLAGALRHGILRERQAEFVTDALRAALLEWAGYDTKVFEFVSTEHTSKNLMIAATRSPRRFDREMSALRVRQLAGFYGIKSQRLANQLDFDLAASQA